MREIKFRIFEYNKMHYPEQYKENKFDNYFIDLNGEPRYYQNCYDGGFFDTDNAKLMQFTGLHDKNGKEIYEGDITDDGYGNIGVVKYGEYNCSCCEGVYGWYVDGGDIRGAESFLEVIGNIYENPELLKGADNIE